MSAQFVQVAPDSSGKKVQTFENTISTQTVEAQAVVLVDSSGAEITALPVTGTRPSSGSVSSVSNSASSVTLLSSNSSRRSATIYNDDTAASLYVKFGTTASTSSFTVKMAPGSYYEFPQPCYTGRVDGIASVATGAARITETS